MPYNGTSQTELKHLLGFVVTPKMHIEQSLCREVATEQSDGVRWDTG
jgi:hypothetical protein